MITHSKGQDEQARQNIIHAYMVLLSRGINGTYVYSIDENLRDYLANLVFTTYLVTSKKEKE